MKNYPPGVTGFEPQINPPGPKGDDRSPLYLFRLRDIYDREALVVAKSYQHARALVADSLWHPEHRPPLPVGCKIQRLDRGDVEGEIIEDDGPVWDVYKQWRREGRGAVISPLSERTRG